MIVLLSIVSVAALIKAKRENAHNDVQEIPFTVAILITIIGYLLLETKVAPFADIRYVMIVLPMITVFLLKWCWDVCRVLLSKATVTALIFIAVATICVCSYTEERVKYLFPQWVEEREAVEPYYQYDAIVVADEDWKVAGNMVLHLEEYGKSYIIKKNQIDQLPELKLKTGAVIYVERDEQMDENRISLENTLHTDLTHLWTNEYMEIFFAALMDDQGWNQGDLRSDKLM